MNVERYHELHNDQKVFKAFSELDLQCTTPCKRYSIGVYFNPPDLRTKEINLTKNKAFLGVYPSTIGSSSYKPVIKNELIILMFSDNAMQAYSMRLTMDCLSGKAHLKVLDFPEEDNGRVCERAALGFEKQIHPNHVQFLRSVEIF